MPTRSLTRWPMCSTMRLPRIALMLYDEPRGLRDYDHGGLKWLDDVQRLGRERLAQNPEAMRGFEQSIAAGKGSDLAVMLYTSGTTGRPKGVMLTYDNVLISARNGN